MNHKIQALLLSLTFLALSPHTAIAASGSITFSGGAEGFVFSPGSSLSETDLFPNLKAAMPGDVLTEDIEIRNTSSAYDYIKIYLRADPHDDSDNLPVSGSDAASANDFLSQLTMRIYNDGTQIYAGSPDQPGSLVSNVFLGQFSAGQSATLTVELTIPANLGNAYAHRTGEVDWIITAEGYIDGELQPGPLTADTGGNPHSLVADIISISALPLVISALVIGIIVLGLRKYRHKS